MIMTELEIVEFKAARRAASLKLIDVANVTNVTLNEAMEFVKSLVTFENTPNECITWIKDKFGNLSSDEFIPILVNGIIVEKQVRIKARSGTDSMSPSFSMHLFKFLEDSNMMTPSKAKDASGNIITNEDGSPVMVKSYLKGDMRYFWVADPII